MTYRPGVGVLALGLLFAVGCQPSPPPPPAVPKGTPCGQLVIACYDEFAHEPANLTCFLPRSRWNRTELRWKLAGFLSDIPRPEQVASAERAFATWSTVSTLTFLRVGETETADIAVSFVEGEHDDPFPFDGAGHVLGHAFFPSSPSPGAVHIDAAGVLATHPEDGEFALYTVLLHEIGHVLGLEHDPNSESVMAPSYHVREDMGLAVGDVSAIQRLYGSRDVSVAPLAVLPPAECRAPPGDLTAENPDADGDGIPDTIEIFVLGTDFNNVDTDGDGVSDYEEVFRAGTPPNNPVSADDPDDDADFLPLSLETTIGTERSNPDTDGDGLLDGIEVFRLGTDPLKADTDDDGIDDANDPFPTNAAFSGESNVQRPLPDCNDNGVRDDDDMAAGTSEDCNQNGVPDECDLAGGAFCDANANGRPDVCEPGNICADADLCTTDRAEDCVCVHIPRDCDDGVFCNGQEACAGGVCLQGTSPCGTNEQCNEDQDVCVPTASGPPPPPPPPPPPDCNGNGVPDDQDIAAATSFDLNENGVPDECEAVILFVSQGADGTNDGSSWLNAFNDLQAGLNQAGARVEEGAVAVEIWVAEGTYRPAPPSGKRSDTFRLLKNVALYGGFAGVETSRRNRVLSQHVTQLSGDLLGNDGLTAGDPSSDNTFHVVDASFTDITTVLDGFQVLGGSAIDGQAPPDFRGGGLHIVNGAPLIRNCTFVGNRAAIGGAVYSSGGTPNFFNTVFLGNGSFGSGGAVVLEGGGAGVFGSCTIALNNAGDGSGGGLLVIDSELNLVNCIVAANQAQFGPPEESQISAKTSGALNVRYSFVNPAPANLGGVGNIGPGLAPGFANIQTGDLHLGPGSPCIDAGNNLQVPAFLTLDRDGLPRIMDDPPTPNTGNPSGTAAIVDMGAFEFSAATQRTVPPPGP